MKKAELIYTKHKMLIPALVLTSFCVLTIVPLFRGTVEINGIDYEFMLTPEHYGAFVVLTINFVAYFRFRLYYKYVLLLTLLLGLFSVINFTPIDEKWFLRIGNLKLKVQPTSFIVGLLTIALNFKKIINLMPVNSGQTIENDLVYEQNKFKQDVEKFKKNYSSKSLDELSQILTDNRFTAAALEAARQMLEEKQVKN